MKVDSIQGKAWCYGKNINTDLIYPGRYLSIKSPAEMAKFALAGLDSKFAKNVTNGDILVVDENFGCGSSREQAVMCLKFAGISAVIAVSFARIFYRNLINQGIFALVSKDAINLIKTGDRLDINFRSGVVKKITSGDECSFQPLPNFIEDIIIAGGIIPHLRKKMQLNTSNHDHDDIHGTKF